MLQREEFGLKLQPVRMVEGGKEQWDQELERLAVEERWAKEQQSRRLGDAVLLREHS